MTLVEIKESIIESLIKEFQDSPTFNSDILESKVEDAINDVQMYRNYPEYYTDEWIEKDMTKLFTIIKRVARVYYNRTGNEHTDSTSENGISQTYTENGKLFAGVIPLSRC